MRLLALTCSGVWGLSGFVSRSLCQYFWQKSMMSMSWSHSLSLIACRTMVSAAVDARTGYAGKPWESGLRACVV